jgi:hypothetical protein
MSYGPNIANGSCCWKARRAVANRALQAFAQAELRNPMNALVTCRFFPGCVSGRRRQAASPSAAFFDRCRADALARQRAGLSH